MATEHSGIVDWSSAQVWALRRTSIILLSLSAVNGSIAPLDSKSCRRAAKSAVSSLRSN